MSQNWMAISVVADIYLEIGERRCKMGDFALREAFDLLQNGRNRWDSISNTFHLTGYEEFRYLKTARPSRKIQTVALKMHRPALTIASSRRGCHRVFEVKWKMFFK